MLTLDVALDKIETGYGQPVDESLNEGCVVSEGRRKLR